jgi:hypothetical protein
MFTNEDAFVSSAASFGNGAGWVISGSFEGSLSGLTSNSLGSMGLFDAYAARLALDGTHQWSFRYGGANSENASAISTTPDGSVVFVGSFNGSISFGAHTVNGTLNAYATRMSPSLTNPTHEWAVSLGGSEADTPWGVATAADGSVYLTSSFSGMTTVGEDRSTAARARAHDPSITGSRSRWLDQKKVRISRNGCSRPVRQMLEMVVPVSERRMPSTK